MPPMLPSPRPKTRRVVVGAALTFAVFLSGCAGEPTPPVADPNSNVRLTFWTGQADQAEAILENLATEFHTLHPNVTIDVSSGAPATEDLLQKLSASFASDAYPDISYVFGSWGSELESTGRTLDISAQVSDPAVKWADLPEVARKTAQPTRTKTIGFPCVVDNLALIYNKTVFDAAGVAYPNPDWTWDDFRAAAKNLTNPSTNTFGYGYPISGSENTTWQFWPHLWQNGGEVLSPDGKTAAFGSQAGVDALTFLRAMAVEDKSVYLDQTDTKFEPLFASDRIGMITSGPWELFNLKVAGTKYGVVQLPGTGGDHQTISGPDLWALFDHKDPNRAHWAYEFTKWLTDPAQDVKYNVAYGNLPLRPIEMDTPEYKAQARDLPGLDAMAKNLANARKARPTIQGYVPLSEAVGEAIASVLQGQGDPRGALDAAVTTADKALAGE